MHFLSLPKLLLGQRNILKTCSHTTHRWSPPTFTASLYAVLNGMDLVKEIEGVGTGSGKPKKKVTIAKSGELPKKSWV